MQVLKKGQDFTELMPEEIFFCLKDVHFENFFKGSTSEEFAAMVLQDTLSFRKVRHGEHGKEADLIFDDEESFEITLICDRKKTKNLIHSIRSVAKGEPLQIPDAEKEILNNLENRIEAKKEKAYRTENTNLCLISPLPIINWEGEPNVVTDKIFWSTRVAVFQWLCSEYKTPKTFKNIYILFPGTDTSWWLIGTDGRLAQYFGDVKNEKYPYFFQSE